MTTNNLNNECLNDFTVTGGVSGSLRKLSVENDNNAGSTVAAVEHYIAGTTADDPYCSCIVGTTASYAMGIDVDDSQSFKLGYAASAAATPSSTTLLETDTDSHNFYPFQPCCRAYVTGTQTNVTGDGTEVTVQFNTEEFDVGSNYNTGTYTFTAPIDGKYMICTCVYLEGVDANKTGTQLNIYKNAGILVKNATAGGAVAAGDEQDFVVSAITELSASDTVHITIVCAGVNKTVDIIQDRSMTNSFLSVYLIG